MLRHAFPPAVSATVLAFVPFAGLYEPPSSEPIMVVYVLPLLVVVASLLWSASTDRRLFLAGSSLLTAVGCAAWVTEHLAGGNALGPRMAGVLGLWQAVSVLTGWTEGPAPAPAAVRSTADTVGNAVGSAAGRVGDAVRAAGDSFGRAARRLGEARQVRVRDASRAVVKARRSVEQVEAQLADTTADRDEQRRRAESAEKAVAEFEQVVAMLRRTPWEFVGRLLPEGTGGEFSDIVVVEPVDAGRFPGEHVAKVASMRLDPKAEFNRRGLARMDIEYRAYMALAEVPERDRRHFLRLVDARDDRDAAIKYLVFERVRGGTLRDRLGPVASDRDPAHLALTLPELLRLLDHVLQALSVLHGSLQVAMVHRDIKPANIMVRRDGTAVVIDLGTATPADPALRMEFDGGIDTLGTVEYAAPEQLSGDHLDRRVDLFAVGAIAYEALTGWLPYTHRPWSPTDQIVAPEQGKSTFGYAPLMDLRGYRPDLPAPVVEFVDAMLAWDPEDRPVDADAARALLRRAVRASRHYDQPLASWPARPYLGDDPTAGAAPAPDAPDGSGPGAGGRRPTTPLDRLRAITSSLQPPTRELPSREDEDR